MKKTVLKKRLAQAIEAVIHQQRLRALSFDKSLINKEIDRYSSRPASLYFSQKSGDPGRKITNHG